MHRQATKSWNNWSQGPNLPKQYREIKDFCVGNSQTLNNKTKVNKIQESINMWLVEHLHPNCEVQSTILGKRKDSTWNCVRMWPNLSKNMIPFRWCWAWQFSRRPMTVVVESWLQHILKETQQLLNWNCEAASTHSRWSCWLICGEFKITAPTGVSKDLIGAV